MENVIRCMVESQDAKLDGRKLHLEKIEWVNEINGLHDTDQNIKFLFHGTPPENIPDLIKNGIDPNRQEMSGLIGKGFYLSNLIEQSIYYSLKYTYNPENVAGIQIPLIVFKVSLGKCIEFSYSDLSRTLNINKLQGYDSHCKKYMHGYEYCVFDSDKIVPVCILYLRSE